jgi:peptidoglycan hydrolase-like protein with peptidoglycan-binding domain
VDGVWTPELTDALTEFQTALGVTPTGTVDAATLHALEQAIADARAAATSTTTEPDTTDTTT